MSKPLAELRANPPKAHIERSYTVCLRPDLLAEVQALTDELANMSQSGGEDEPGPPKRAGGPSPREREIRARLAELVEEMAEHEGELRLRLGDDGEWRRWVDAHPARDEGQPGHQRDLEVTLGYCNADDLIDNLGTYVYSYDGEPLEPDDWASWMAASVAPPDKKAIANLVVAMSESRLDIPKWRVGLSDSLSRLRDSDSSATSASAPAASTGGSRARSKSGTTKKATPAP